MLPSFEFADSCAFFVNRSPRNGEGDLDGPPEAPREPRASAAGDAPRGMVLVLFAITFAAAMAQLIVLGALPTFAAELDVSGTAVAWLLTAFMVANAVTTPIFGRLGDMFGYRRVLTGVLLLFVVGTLICVVADMSGSYLGLLVGRALQGTSGGVFPLVIGMVRAVLPGERALPLIGILSAMAGIGGAIAMVASGPIAGVSGTTALFWLTLVLALVALAGVPLLPDTRPSRSGRLDVIGALLLSVALCCLLVGVSEGKTWGWLSAGVLGLFGGSVVAFAVFAMRELDLSEPLIDLRLMCRRSLAATNVATVIIAAAMFGVMTLQPQYVQAPDSAPYGFGLSLSESGIVMAPIAIMMVIGSRVSARVARRIGARSVFRIGAGLVLLSCLYMVLAHHRLIDFFIAGAIAGTAYGLGFASIGTLVAANVERAQTGVATGVNAVLRTIGGAIGAQIAAAVLLAHTPAGERLPAAGGYSAAFGLLAIIAVGAFAATLLIPRDRAAGAAVPAARSAPGPVVVGAHPGSLVG